MKIRAIGTGSAYCRHPLIPPAFLIQTGDSSVLVGCPYQIVARLEALNLPGGRVDMILLLGIKGHQAGGIEELARRAEARGGELPMLVAPASLIEALKRRLVGVLPQPLEHYFVVRETKKVTIKEEHCSENFSFLQMAAPDYSKSFCLVLEEAKILISGEASLPNMPTYDDELQMILYDAGYGVDGKSRVVAELVAELPIYIQQKIWLYGYPDGYQALVDPLPMLFLPPNACVYDSGRKGKYFDKERFLREEAKRKQGNASTSSA